MSRPTSLIKFMADQNSNGRGKLFWARSGDDGAPFRGPMAPMMTGEEYEDRVVRVRDPHIDVYDIGVPEQRAAYQAVMDKIVNGWGELLFVDRRFSETAGTWIVYVEWTENYMEDGMPSASHNPMAAMSGGGNAQLPHGG